MELEMDALGLLVMIWCCGLFAFRRSWRTTTGFTPVYLNVYDLLGSTPLNHFTYWLGFGLFHSAVEVYGVEYCFLGHPDDTSGVFEVEPKQCPGFTYRKSFLIGWTNLGAKDVSLLIEEKLSQDYVGNSYDLLRKNCNHFSKDCCKLLTGKPIPNWVNRLARLGRLCGCAPQSSIIEDDDAFAEEKEDPAVICLPRTKTETHKELRKFLEEERMLCEGALSQIEENSKEEEEEETEQLPRLTLGTRDKLEFDLKLSFAQETEVVEEEDEELRMERGKGNVEKWLQLLLEYTRGDSLDSSPPKLAQECEVSSFDEIIQKLNEKFPKKEIKVLKSPDVKKKEESVEVEARNPRSVSIPRRLISTEPNNHEKKIEETIAIEARKPSSISTPRRSITRETDNTCKGSEAKKNVGGAKRSISGKGSETRKSSVGKEKGMARTEIARFFRRIPSSSSMILNMKKGVDCLRKKPLVINDDENDYQYGNGNHPVGKNSFFKSFIKSIKRLSMCKVRIK